MDGAPYALRKVEARRVTLSIENLNLRVNGIPQIRVCIDLGIEDGFPGGPKRLVVEDPLLGEVVLNDNCLIECQWVSDNPQVIQRGWMAMQVSVVIELLEQIALGKEGKTR